ncbi:MAG: HEAT repeat domain-containing protein [Candidatus Thorarchaeota archaeon]|nr:HEAT repeat domain-containing protein [Candidatus Thorarchaeota archaeon]
MSETRRMLLDFQTEEVGKRARANKNVRNALVKAIKDTSDIVRQRALIATIDLADPTIVTDVVNSLKDDEEEVRITAAEVLAWYQQPSTIPNFLEGLKDSNTWVRSHCANGLSKLVGGPIWARLPEAKVDQIIADFPDMDEEQVRVFLIEIKVRADQIDRFLRWRKENFEVDIDISVIEEMESGPIIMDGAEIGTAVLAKPTGIAPEVEEILAELPDDLRDTLPEEDLRRLTPATARELVNTLLSSIGKSEEKKPVKKKTVRVKKVKKVVKKTGRTREELLDQIPDEVKENLPDDVLDGLSVDELEAVVASSSESGASIPSLEEDTEEAEKEKPKKKSEKKGTEEDERVSILAEKYGEEKAEILAAIPEEMLAGIPDDQIEEMDIDSLKDLASALEPR